MLYPVNPKALARYREAFHPTPSGRRWPPSIVLHQRVHHRPPALFNAALADEGSDIVMAEPGTDFKRHRLLGLI